MNNITQLLIDKKEEKYKKFSKKIIPDTKLEILGVRVPNIKKIARLLKAEQPELISTFINDYTHTYYEEWFLHGLLLQNVTDIDNLFALLDNFLLYVDNWAICDSTASVLKIVKKYPEKFYKKICEWIESNKTYVVRFAIVLLNDYYLDNYFSEKLLKKVIKIASNNYYVKMAKAWFLSTSLIKQYEKTIWVLQQKVLDKFTHNKTIQKAIDSYRIDADIKIYLKTLRI